MRRPRLLVQFLSCAFLPILLCISASSGSASASPTSEVSGPIAEDTSWTLVGSPYVVTGDVTVNPGVSLQIEPGVQVRFDGNYALIMRGSLMARGTESQPILFTSNQDTPAPGDWAMLDFRAGSQFGLLHHVIVEYGGNPGRTGAWCLAGALCVNTSSFELDQSIVRHNATRGLILVQADGLVTNNTFDDHPQEAIRLHGCDTRLGPCRPTIAGNSFTNNASPIARHGPQDPILVGNQASDNEINGFLLASCRSEGENTWQADLPYVIPGWCNVGGYGPTALTIEPGAVVKIDGGGLVIKGSSVLTATGTTDQPIVFTSFADDSVGGDTNGDSGATTPAPNDYYDISVTDAGSSAFFEHAIFRYGGGRQLVIGPLVVADWSATLTIRHCDLSRGEVGVSIWRAASLTLEESLLHDNSYAGVSVYGEGEVLVAGNRFLNSATGVIVSAGHPTLRDNVFQGNTLAVDVRCNPFFGNCAPVVSPGNRFVGAGQHAVINHHPAEGCIEASGNWWGDDMGPSDWSSEQDPCGLMDNPGGGGVVSDGVNYSPWQGGVTRPLIVWPSCGVTARGRPTFEGRAQAEATVAFYDGAVELGQTTCAVDHSFSWTPGEPLADGPHIIIAQATLGSHSSLPSPELPLTVDTTLPFDPAGIRISYSMHNVVYTQPMRDSSGCASTGGDMRTPLWVREGAQMTVTVPMRNQTSPLLASLHDRAVQLPRPLAKPGPLLEATRIVTITVRNDTNHTITHVRCANHAGDDKGVYGPSQKLKHPLPPGEDIVQAIEIEEPRGQVDLAPYVDVVYETRPGRVVARADDLDLTLLQGDAPAVAPPSDQGLGEMILDNATGRDVVKLHFVWEEGGVGKQTPGGSFASEQHPFRQGEQRHFFLPKGGANQFWVVMEDIQGNIHCREVRLGPTGRPEVRGVGQSQPGGVVELTNELQSQADVCEIRLYRHEIREDPHPTRGLQLISGYRIGLPQDDIDQQRVLKKGQKVTLHLEHGDFFKRYSFAAYDCAGKPVWYKKNIYLDADFVRDWKIRECAYPGKWRIVPSDQPGSEPIDVLLQVMPRALSAAEDGFTTYFASTEAIAGKMYVVACVMDPNSGAFSEQEVELGEALKDPDGYVYDAELGIVAPIPGATVSCDVFDEQVQVWDRWPAELYDGQINPQITTEDGYYAFLVPSGLFRVRAQAEGYATHTSPDLRVINEAVHYNVPMEKPRLYVPMLLR